jgi:hypothetical protein
MHSSHLSLQTATIADPAAFPDASRILEPILHGLADAPRLSPLGADLLDQLFTSHVYAHQRALIQELKGRVPAGGHEATDRQIALALASLLDRDLRGARRALGPDITADDLSHH